MLITDTIHHYKAFEQLVAHCRVRIYQHNERYVVVATEMPDNQAIAITNYWPELANEIAQQHNLDLTHTVWIEHYPQGNYAREGERGDTFDQITLENGEPHWQRITREAAEQLIGEQEHWP